MSRQAVRGILCISLWVSGCTLASFPAPDLSSAPVVPVAPHVPPVIDQAACPPSSGLVLCFDAINAAKVQQWIRDLDQAARACHDQKGGGK